MLVVATSATKTLILASGQKHLVAMFASNLLLYWSYFVPITCSVLFLQFIATTVATSLVAAGLSIKPL